MTGERRFAAATDPPAAATEAEPGAFTCLPHVRDQAIRALGLPFAGG